MSVKHRGFTLIELLVVIAIIEILAATLFPVFQEAKETAKRTKCLNNFSQTSKAIQEYAQDWDEKTVLTNYLPCTTAWCKPDTNLGPNKSWPQLTMPYITTWEVLRCPADPNATNEGLSFIPASGEVAITQQEIQFSWATRTNHGYNSQYFCPMVFWKHGKPGPAPISLSQIKVPGDCLLFLESIWDRISNGYPSGGGRWAVDPPCRYFKNPSSGQTKDTFPIPPGEIDTLFQWGCKPTSDCAWNIFCGVFVFHQGEIIWSPCSDKTQHTWKHRNYGLVIVSFADGHNRLLRMDQILYGCDFKPGWTGYIWDRDSYLWDLQ
ncbi:MAG TPA: type II secretion system protein [Fimbriimonadales bacterium]|nr:type II secretion system protein [Fimbriimonadales bacterium]